MKILIAPLGVGDSKANVYERQYRTAKYKFKDEIAEEPFILSILIKKLKVDKVIVVGTAKSMWEKLYEYYAKKVNEFDEKYWVKIGEKVGKSNYKNYALSEDDLKIIGKIIDKYLKNINPNAVGGSKCKIIKYGIDENEIWENFDLFMNLINEVNDGDEIYLDITHSFRSIPLFMYVMLEFMRYFKNVKLKGIYYGMLDIRHEYNGIAPVIDLSPIFKVSEWIKGMYEFTTYGNSYLISKLLEMEDENIAEILQKISRYIDANYLKEFREELKKLKHLLNEKNDKKDSGKFLKYFIPELNKFIDKLNYENSDVDFQLSMAYWFFNNKKYSSGYLCLTDAIFWKLCEIYNIPPIYKNRKLMKDIVYNPAINREYDVFKQINSCYNKLRNIRNKIAHADVCAKGNEFNPEEDLKEVINLLNNAKLPNFDAIIETLLNDANINQNEMTLKLLKDILNLLIIKKIVNAYNFENNEIYWEFVSKYLLNRNNKFKNDKLRELCQIFHSSIENTASLEHAFNNLKNIKDEDLLDSLALYNAIMYYTIVKLSQVYNVKGKYHNNIFRWLLLNKKLCSKSPILKEINELYFKIFSNRYNSILSDDVINACDKLIKLLNKEEISKIPIDLPFNVIEKEYSKFQKYREG